MRKESTCNLKARSFPIWCVIVVVFLVAASAQAQVITLSPTSLDYGNVDVGNSSTLAFTVSTPGPADITIDSMTVTISSLPGFQLLTTGTCPSPPFTLVAANPCTVDIEFTPSVSGFFHGEFEVTSGAASTTGALDGQGWDPVAASGIPTLSEMGVALLVLLMAATGVVALRRVL